MSSYVTVSHTDPCRRTHYSRDVWCLHQRAQCCTASVGPVTEQNTAEQTALCLTDIRLLCPEPYLPGLQLCRLRSRGFHWGGHDGRLHRLLLRLLWTRYPERSQRIDPIPGTATGKRGGASGHAFLLTLHVRSVNKVNKMPRFPFFTLIQSTQQLLSVLFSQSIQAFMQGSSNLKFSYLTSSKNLSSSSAGNWESLKGKKAVSFCSL